LRRRLDSLDGSLDGEDRLGRALNLPWKATSIARPQFGELHSRLMDELFVTEGVADLLCDHLVVREHQLTSAPDASGPRALLCLVGPPGVGKSHIAHEIAEQLGLPLATIRLDRLGSPDELFGNERSPGEIMGAIERLGQSEIVLLLEEVDAIGGGWPTASTPGQAISDRWTTARATSWPRSRTQGHVAHFTTRSMTSRLICPVFS